MTLHGAPVTMADINRLPSFCKLIMVDQPGIHSMKDGKNPDILNAPQYHIAKNNPHIHHYCWALISKNRYFGARTRTERNHRVSRFLADTDYVIQNSTSDWPYLHVMYTEQAEILLLNAEYVRGLTKVEVALKHMPEYEKAYAVKSDLYLEMGDKKRSIAVAQEGLAKNPTSRLLRNRLKRQGIQLPEPIEINAGDSSKNQPLVKSQPPTVPLQEQTNKNSGSSDVVKGQEPEDRAKETTGIQNQDTINNQTKLDAATQEKSGPGTANDTPAHKNPYCRFCP